MQGPLSLAILASLTVAGCYLCAAPRSKGTKILVCVSVDSPQTSKTDLSHISSDGGPNSPNEIDQIIMEAKLYSDQLVAASNVPFFNAKSPEAILEEAKKLNIISESTYKSILLLQVEESKYFNDKMEVNIEFESRHKKKSACISSIPLRSGQSCYFMSRFLVTWKFCDKIAEDRFHVTDFHSELKEGEGKCLCGSCIVGKEIASIRHMVDADWLYLADILKSRTIKECQEPPFSLPDKIEQNADKSAWCSSYMHLSAQRALQNLKSIPVSARRALPVLVNSQGLLLSIPGTCFQCCPCLSAEAVFDPRVPLGGGYSSYL